MFWATGDVYPHLLRGVIDFIAGVAARVSYGA
jgi:hypothetical protein